ncbi:hypothetical protein Dimus_020797 [Dionaea muscipula]
MLVHVDAVKEFYTKMTVIHLKKKDVVKSSVKGISIEFDHERLATILGVPGRTGICEYIKEVWEESKYTKPLDITRRIANNETITTARRVKSRSGENRRRDDDVNAPEEEAEDEDEGNKDDFDWEAVIDEATVEGESDSGEKFYDAEDEAQGSPDLHDEIPAEAPQSSTRARRKRALRSRLLGSYARIQKAEFTKFRASLKEKGQTDFMMIWRRPKLRMPDF